MPARRFGSIFPVFRLLSLLSTWSLCLTFVLTFAEAQSARTTAGHADATPTSIPRSFDRIPFDGFRETVRRSGLIFEGTVTGIQPELGKGKLLQSYRISFQVHRGVRGVSSNSTLSIREWAGLWNRSLTQAPRYHRGEHVVLFLYAPSRAGLTSTVGGTTGKLAVNSGLVALPANWRPTLPASATPQPNETGTPSPRVALSWLVEQIEQTQSAPAGGR